MNDGAGFEPTRRTLLAAERTWLAWWRSGIAAATAAVLIGGWQRFRRVRDALAHGAYEDVPGNWIAGLTIVGALLAIGTLAVILAQA